MRDFANVQADPWMRQRAAECCLALALSPIFAWMRPFGVDEQAFVIRMGFWLGILACWFLALAITERLFEARGLLRGRDAALRWAAMVGAAAFPMMLIVGPAIYALEGWQPYAHKVVTLYFQIAVIGGGVSLIARAALGQRFAVSATPAPCPSGIRLDGALNGLDPSELEQARPVAVPQAFANGLMGRLPPHLRGRMIALEMEDHYARVHTDRGSGLILMRLGDAMAEAAPTPGRQVHRSWWVADAAVASFERVGRTGQVRLSNGLTAPVSQRYLREVDQFLARRGQGEGPPALS
ncbi:hypothetical protein GCM10007301_26120 [Azorhizobium oxalatiphilum]|uniref:HTH LytTR-type domain-containing protein n=1 Tax=Azorhizobium oxalatiphilum TaxID=980631 RepID=A0A917C177_9HYPH|nr:LytTR family DNA-binding domain-containing protein [Azorhizobium oxalatiphilum]GGF65100.1 hypothetical protein GCM10007301_26120 [Azorhizobium oxalatiphilum]